MKKLIVLTAFSALLVLAAISGTASSGNTACFDWSCTGGATSTCFFDSSCSVTTSGTPWKEKWTWGDGTSNLLPPPTATHTYTMGYPTVTLTKYNYTEDSVSVTCQIVAKNQIGPPLPLSGRCQ